MATDWDKLAKDNERKYKDYAPAGRYTVKIGSVEHCEVGTNGSIAQKFKPLDDENYAYPKLTHWLSFKNEDWRKWHNKELMVILGASEENARKAVDVCEGKGDKEKIKEAYQQTYERLLQKAPSVEIEVWSDGQYSRGDFTDGRVRMSHQDDKPYEAPLVGAEEVSEDDLPF